MDLKRPIDNKAERVFIPDVQWTIRQRDEVLTVNCRFVYSWTDYKAVPR